MCLLIDTSWWQILYINHLLIDQSKYLVIIISVKNSDPDLKRQMRKYYANANMLLCTFSHCQCG